MPSTSEANVERGEEEEKEKAKEEEEEEEEKKTNHRSATWVTIIYYRGVWFIVRFFFVRFFVF